jgi:hypothetical protein
VLEISDCACVRVCKRDAANSSINYTTTAQSSSEHDATANQLAFTTHKQCALLAA